MTFADKRISSKIGHAEINTKRAASPRKYNSLHNGSEIVKKCSRAKVPPPMNAGSAVNALIAALGNLSDFARSFLAMEVAAPSRITPETIPIRVPRIRQVRRPKAAPKHRVYCKNITTIYSAASEPSEINPGQRDEVLHPGYDAHEGVQWRPSLFP
jgi:hypothetical protein